jgi:hypothetical protein
MGAQDAGYFLYRGSHYCGSLLANSVALKFPLKRSSRAQGKC